MATHCVHVEMRHAVVLHSNLRFARRQVKLESERRARARAITI